MLGRIASALVSLAGMADWSGEVDEDTARRDCGVWRRRTLEARETIAAQKVEIAGLEATVSRLRRVSTGEQARYSRVTADAGARREHSMACSHHPSHDGTRTRDRCLCAAIAGAPEGKPAPDSAEWWRQVAQGLSVKTYDAERASDEARTTVLAWWQGKEQGGPVYEARVVAMLRAAGLPDPEGAVERALRSDPVPPVCAHCTAGDHHLCAACARRDVCGCIPCGTNGPPARSGAIPGTKWCVGDVVIGTIGARGYHRGCGWGPVRLVGRGSNQDHESHCVVGERLSDGSRVTIGIDALSDYQRADGKPAAFSAGDVVVCARASLGPVRITGDDGHGKAIGVRVSDGRPVEIAPEALACYRIATHDEVHAAERREETQ